MKAATEAFYLPLILLTVILLGGVKVGQRVAFSPPPLFTLVLAVMLFAVLVRGRVFAPDRLMNASRSPLANLNGLVVVLATFFAATQAFNLVIPELGLPFLLANVFLFVLLLNTMAGSHDRISVLRSLAVVTGAGFVAKFVVLAALSEPGEGTLKRVLYALVEGVTLGTLTQPVLHPSSGYIAFFTLALFMIALWMLPSPLKAQLQSRPDAGLFDDEVSRRARLQSRHPDSPDHGGLIESGE
jgi:hypothetical protein